MILKRYDKIMKRFLTALLACMCILCMSAVGTAAPTNPIIKESDRFDEIPEILRFRQTESGRIEINQHFYARHLLPETAVRNVNDEIGRRVLEMEQKAVEFITPLSGDRQEAELDTGAMIQRTGKKIMSFEIIAAGQVNNEQVYVDVDAYVYDMEDGRRITPDDLFDPESEAWEILENRTREQLEACFPDTEADAETLERLSSPEHLSVTPFTMTPGRLIFHYRADELYEGRNTLINVEIWYPEIEQYMKEEIRSQTVNTCYRLAALTFDDGPAKGSTNLLIYKLMKYGVTATFFNVGSNVVKRSPGAVCREHDLCFDVGSHGYEHEVKVRNVEQGRELLEKTDELYLKMLGVRPVLFRAPGGNFGMYKKAGNDLPMIKWSVSCGDTTGSTDEEIIMTLSGRPNAGDIVLMHDLSNNSSRYMEECLPALENRNILFVTVRELCSIYGLELNSEDIVTGCEEQVVELLK